jgi:hypothetical protein
LLSRAGDYTRILTWLSRALETERLSALEIYILKSMVPIVSSTNILFNEITFSLDFLLHVLDYGFTSLGLLDWAFRLRSGGLPRAMAGLFSDN